MIRVRTITMALGLLTALSIASLTSSSAYALDDGLARTPPMGWNSWNKFQCGVSEDLIRGMADAMVSSGMKDAGYEYVIIDDCWQSSRDVNGNIVADAKRFPSGMQALADYVHSKGLKFGLYSDAGEFTCQRKPGSKGHELQDAKQYAAWGVDYVKYDWCSTQGLDQRKAYIAMRDAIAQSGRPMVLSICEWGTSKPWTWAGDVGHLWRTLGDIQDCWDCKGGPPGPPPNGANGAPPPAPPPGFPAMGLGVVQIIDAHEAFAEAAGPGHWNDPDMLEVGNGGMTDTEYRAHFSLWSLLAAPLIAGNDLRSMSQATQDILTNKEVIAIDQDSLGKQGRRLRRNGELEVWSKELADGGRAVVLLNRGASYAAMNVSWIELGLPGDQELKVRDLWAGADLGAQRGVFSTQVDGHSAVMLRISPLR